MQVQNCAKNEPASETTLDHCASFPLNEVLVLEESFNVVGLEEVFVVDVVKEAFVITDVVDETFVVLVGEGALVVVVVETLFWLFDCTLATGVVVVAVLASFFQSISHLRRPVIPATVMVMAGTGYLDEQQLWAGAYPLSAGTNIS